VSASQYIFPSETVNQTSIIVAQTFIISTLSIFGTQVAIIIISAIVVNFLKFFVLLLQLITVAQAFISREVIGFQTMLLFPITQATFHSKFIF